MNSTQIAKLAHVSRSTVSRVVNGYSNVPAQTRQRVQAVIDQYGYKPNASARTLAGKSNDMIALFLAEDTPPHAMQFLLEVIASCKARGLQVLVNTVAQASALVEIQQYLDSRLIRGAICLGLPAGQASLPDAPIVQVALPATADISLRDIAERALCALFPA